MADDTETLEQTVDKAHIDRDVRILPADATDTLIAGRDDARRYRGRRPPGLMMRCRGALF